MPAALRHRHTTRPRVWGRIHVVSGELRYRVLGPTPVDRILSSARPAIVEPEVPHEVEPIGEVRFWLEFLEEPSQDRSHSLAAIENA